MPVTPGQSHDTIPRTVPKRALVISLAALAVPIVSAQFLPDMAAEEYGLLVWLLALVPAFLLTYYRGLTGAAVAVAAGMAALTLSQILLLSFGVSTLDLGWLLLVVANFLIVTGALAVFAELLHRERRKVEGLALADQLTRLPNRRHAELALDREFAAAVRGRKLGLVVYDIDHFKQFNDTYGHAAGDDVLRAFGEVLRHYTRKQNVSARYGGEEFISVVSDVDLDGVLVFANRVRDAIKSKELPWGRVSVSGGVAMYQNGMGSYEVLVAAADQALYAAKSAGRDRIEVAREAAPTPERVTAPRVAAPGRPLRILVVDAEPDVRTGLVAALSKHGFDTAQTGSPEDAARLLRDAEMPFDALVTSLVMPRISGFTLVNQLSPDAPDLRVIYMSESMREQVSWPGVPGAVHRFIKKPVDPTELVNAVEQALGEQAGTAD